MIVISTLRRVRDNRGQTLIEFSIIALLLVMLLVAVIDVGRLILTYTAIHNAARAGTRYAIVHGKDAGGGDVATYLKTWFLDPAGIDTMPVTNPTDLSTASAGTFVTVTVTYDYKPFATYFLPVTIPLQSTSQGVIVY